ncbi:MAG: tetratricopeptide repeat protein [Cetobacterium sp.]|uniref:tetratricopeptide repeat protein n=1 Tax=Cetobacterium sp. TaxID=2071632 RepID=UPI003F3FB8FE
MNDDINKALENYNIKNYNDAFIYFKKARNNLGEEEFDKIYSFKFICTIYNSIIKNLKSIDKECQEWIKYIIKFSKNKDFFYKITVFKVIEILLKKPIVEYKKIIIWLLKLDPNVLSIEQGQFEIDGKIISLCSEKEKYYMHLSKAYEKIKDLKNAAEISKIAIKELKQFTNDSDIWFLRRIALYNISQENYEEALKNYKEIMKQKKDWFILKEIAEVYFFINKFEIGKKYLLDAIYSPGELDKKLNLFFDVYKYLNIYDKKIALDALKIYFKIRLENNWKISIEDEKIANLENINLVKDKEDLIKISTKYFIEKCKKLRWENEPLYIGKVENVKDKFFFIKVNTGEKYFCKIKNYPEKKKPLEGIVVNFNLIETFDSKKNKYTFSAINLNFVKCEGN